MSQPISRAFCKVTKHELPIIWCHPNIDGQFIAALTQESAYAIFRAVTGIEVDIDKFIPSGNYAWYSRIISTKDELERSIVRPDMYTVL